MERITPDKITKLKPNEIFVFGSNKQGHHAGGAAAYACVNFGAEWGNGYGLQGQSYAIPTLSFAGGTEDHRLPLSEIMGYVGEFIKFAKQHPEYVFLVTPIGCGIAGFTAEQIAPMFKKALNMKNIYLPKAFIDVLGCGVVRKLVGESIKRILGESPIVTHESLFNIFTMSEERRSDPLMEGRFTSYDHKYVKKCLDKRYGDDAEVVMKEDKNGNMNFCIKFGNSDFNQRIVDDDMRLCGCVPTHVELKEGKREVQYEPISVIKCINNLPEWIYCGVFLRDVSSNALKNAIKDIFNINLPSDWRIYCHHMTLAFNNGSQDSTEIFKHYLKLYGRVAELTATELGVSDKAIAVKVKWDDMSGNAINHVTVAVSPNGNPADSNKITNWKPLPQPIKLVGKIGFFGKDKQVHGN